MLDEPQILRTTAQPIAIIHLTVPRAEIQRIMGPAHPAAWRTELNRPLVG